MHVYRWDLDRTYLDTDIHSVRGMIRTALESADAKRTMPGAPALLRALLDHDPRATVSVLSGSPTQMREVLSQKLALDGVRVDSLVLKDNLRNLRRGRLRALRGQLGFKLPHLFTLRLGASPTATETLFGDDSEVDALVYALYAEALAGRVPDALVLDVLRAGGAYPDQLEEAARSLARLVRTDVVEDAFIHVDRGLPLSLFEQLGGRVVPVFSWYQAALRLITRGRLAMDALESVVRGCAGRAPFDARTFVALTQDAVRRGLTPADDARAAFEVTPSLRAATGALERALDHLGDHRRRHEDHGADWLGFLRSAAGSEPGGPTSG